MPKLHRILEDRAAHSEVRAGAVVTVGSDAVDAIATRAAEAGMHVLVARAPEQPRPFGVAVELLRPALERLRDRERDAALAGPARLAEPVLCGGEARGASELSVMHGLYWLVSNLADRTPLALLVRDAQLADAASQRLFAYLSQRIDELPVALVLARA